MDHRTVLHTFQTSLLNMVVGLIISYGGLSPTEDYLLRRIISYGVVISKLHITVLGRRWITSLGSTPRLAAGSTIRTKKSTATNNVVIEQIKN